MDNALYKLEELTYQVESAGMSIYKGCSFRQLYRLSILGHHLVATMALSIFVIIISETMNYY